MRRAHGVGLWDRLSRLIQGVQGAKSLDATSRWCRPPSMAGEQGWSGAAMRANLDVKRETQRASAGAHRVACFESPSPVRPRLVAPWPVLPGLDWLSWGEEICTHKSTEKIRSVETIAHREGHERHSDRERQCSKGGRRSFGAQPRIQSSAAPHLTQLNPAFRI